MQAGAIAYRARMGRSADPPMIRPWCCGGSAHGARACGALLVILCPYDKRGGARAGCFACFSCRGVAVSGACVKTVCR